MEKTKRNHYTCFDLVVHCQKKLDFDLKNTILLKKRALNFSQQKWDRELQITKKQE